MCALFASVLSWAARAGLENTLAVDMVSVVYRVCTFELLEVFEYYMLVLGGVTDLGASPWVGTFEGFAGSEVGDGQI